jgi:hypothetical protein
VFSRNPYEVVNEYAPNVQASWQDQQIGKVGHIPEQPDRAQAHDRVSLLGDTRTKGTGAGIEIPPREVLG